MLYAGVPSIFVRIFNQTPLYAVSASKGCITMADVKLSRPASGQQLVVSSASDARLILDFPADQVSIDRPEGSSSLFFHFDDGASIELQNFYGAYNKEALPEFEIDGQLIAGTDFFEAFGPDLIPAAGPSAAARGARYNQHSDMGLTEGLTEGVWHLNELDYRLSFDGAQAENELSYGFIDNVAPALSTSGAPIAFGLKEASWKGDGSEDPGVPSMGGSFTVRDPDSDSLTATVTIGGKTVAVSLGGPTTVESDYGTLVITPTGGGSNITFNFEYTLKQGAGSKTDQLAEGEIYTDGIVISVNDGEGHTVNQPINAVITGSNDAPDITGVNDLTLKDDGVWAAGEREEYAKGNYKLNTAENTPITADGTAAGQRLIQVDGKITAIDPDNGDTLTYGFKSVTINGATKEITPDPIKVPEDGFDTVYTVDGYGTLHLDSATGDYRFVLDTATGSTVDKLAEGQPVKISFVPTVKDNHGDTDQASGTMRDGTGTPGGEAVDITIIGSNDRPYFADNAVTWTKNDNTVKEDGKLADRTVSGQINGTDIDNDGADLVYGFQLGNASVSTLYVVPKGDGYEFLANPPGDGNYYGTITMTKPDTGEFKFELNNRAKCVQALDNDSPGEGITITVPAVVQDVHGAWNTTNIEIRIDGTNDEPRVLGGFVLRLRDEGVYGKEAAEVTTDGTYKLTHSENEETVVDKGGDVYDVHAGKHKLSATNKIFITDVDKGDNEHLEWGIKLSNGEAVKVSDKSTADAALGESVSVYIDGDGKVISQEAFDAKVSEASGKGETFNDYYGKVTFWQDGSYKFELNNALDSPADKLGEYKDGDAGTVAEFNLSFYANDGKLDENGDKTTGAGLLYGTNVTITVRGSNDAPTITGHTSTLDITERGFSNASADETAKGSMTAHDSDTGDTKTYGFALGGTAGTLDGATLHRDLYVVSDDKGGVKLSATEVDGKTYGTLTMDGNGNYTFKLENGSPIVQAMPGGQELKLPFPVAVVDKYGAYDHESVNLTIKGSNDAPVLEVGSNKISVKEAGVANGNTVEAGIPRAEGKISVADDDSGLAANPYAIVGVTEVDNDGWMTIKTDYGILHLNTTTGVYKYELDNDSLDTQKLHQGHTVTDTIKITVKDAHNAVLETNIAVTITGTNDKPTIKFDDPKMSFTEDGTKTAIGKFGTKAEGAFSDDDAADSHTYHLVMADKVGEYYDANTGTKSVGTPKAGDFGNSIKGEYGTLTMQSDGTYTYTLDNSSKAVQGLTATDKPIETFYVMVKDSKGGFDIKPITVTVNGQDDKITLTTTDVHTVQVTEAGVEFNKNTDVPAKDGVLGTLKVTMPDDDDAEGGANHIQYGFKITDANGDVTYVRPGANEEEISHTIGGCGTLTIDKNGKYSFTLANDGSKINALNAGDKALLTALMGGGKIEFAVWDDRHADSFCSTQKLELTVNGTNDRPYFTVKDTDGKILSSQTSENALTEDSAKYAELHGNLTADDPDAEHTPDNLKFSLVGEGGKLLQVVEGKYGVLHLYENGGYKYTLTNPGALQHLNPGEVFKDETFTVRVLDNLGAYTDKTLVIELTGAADDPVIGSKNLAVKEAGFETPGIVEHGGELGVTVTDAQDTPLTGTVTYSYNGTEVSNNSTEISGNYGTLTLNPDGTYSYKLNNANSTVNKLNVGDSTSDSFTFQVTATANDAQGNPITVTQDVTVNVKIDGTNDAPTLSGTAVEKGVTWKGVFTDVDGTGKHEFGSVVATGQVSGAQDVDNATSDLDYMIWNGTSAVSTFQGDYGTISMNAEGSYSYYLDTYSPKLAQAIINAKNNGTKLTETFSYKAVDPHGAYSAESKTIEIAISDILPGVDVGNLGTYGFNKGDSELAQSIKEDAGNTEKTPGGEEPDATQTVSGQIEGTWTLIGLVEWESNHGFGIKGQGGNQVQSSAGDGTAVGKYGYIVIDPMTGKYTYTLFNNSKDVQALNQGDIVKEEFTLMRNGAVVKDGGKDVIITITIQGTNDVPVITQAQGATINEDAGNSDGRFAESVTGNITATDADDGETASLTCQVKAGAGPAWGNVVFVKDAAGQWTYTYTANPNATGAPTNLLQGEKAHDTFTVQVSDGKGGTTEQVITITYAGKNDNPTGTDNLNLITISEDAAPLTGTRADLIGALYADDDRGTADLSFSVSATEGGTAGMVAQGKYGTLYLDNNGNYTYSLNNASDEVQKLAQGELATDTFYVTIKDQEGGTSKPVEVTVNITGTNDAPQVNLEKVLLVREGTAESESGMATIVDKDAGDKLTYTVTSGDNTGSFIKGGTDEQSTTVQGKYGTLTLKADGTYTYVLTSHALGVGEKADETFTITVTDGQGGLVSKELKVSIIGANDAPVVTIAGDTLSATDVDGDTLAFTVKGTGEDVVLVNTSETEVKGQFGTLTFTASDDDSDRFTYKYELDTSYEHLTKLSTATVTDGKITDTFGFTVSDGHTGGDTSGSLKINIDVNNWDGKGGRLLFGDDGTVDDTLTGGAGNDILFGGAGDDYLFGDAGNDHLYGGAGNDFLDGGTNNYGAGTGGNHLYGGDGNDVLVFHKGDTIDGGADIDMLVVRGGSLDDLFVANAGGKTDMGTVTNMEILVSSSGSLLNSLTSMSELAEKVGITINGDGTVTKGAGWSSIQDSVDGAWNVYTTTVNLGMADEETVKVAILKSVDG